MWKALLAAFLIAGFSTCAFGQEPHHRSHRHTKAEVKLGADGVPPYVANAVDFDGTNDFLDRAALSGIVNAKVGIISYWIRVDGGDGATRYVLRMSGNNFRGQIRDTNKIRVDGEDTGGTDTLLVVETGTTLASSAWIHVLVAWDLSTPEAYLYVDGVDVEDTGSSIELDNVINYNSSIGVGATGSGSNKWDGCISELYFNSAEFLDITQASNRAKFRDGAGKPVSLGSDGSLPTGTSPVLYLNGDATNFEINQGTGGDFTENGALSDCSTSPTD